MKKVLIIAVTIVAVIALGNVLLASAQGGTLLTQPNPACPMSGYTCPFSGTMPYGGPGGMMGRVPGGMMGRRAPGGMMGAYGTNPGTLPGGMLGMHNAMMGANGMHQQVWTAIADELGMTYDELTQAVQNGQTIAQLAEAAGVPLADLKQAAITAWGNSLADLVEEGVITQAQADWMIERMDSMPMFDFELGFGPGMMYGGRGGMMGRGMMRNWQPPAGPQG